MNKKKIASLLMVATTSISSITIPSVNVHAVEKANDNNQNNVPKNKQVDNAIRTSIKKGKVINVRTNLRIREDGNLKAKILGYLLNGEEFNIIGETEDWYHIEYNGQKGYVYKEYATPINSSNISYNKPSFFNGKVVNLKTNLRVRIAPEVNSNVIGCLNSGDVLNIRSQCGDWYSIDYNGSIGYINKAYIEKTNLHQSNKKDEENNLVLNAKINTNTNVTIRENPNKDSKALGYLNDKQAVSIKEKKGDWYTVVHNGNKGYIDKNYVKKNEKPNINKVAEKILNNDNKKLENKEQIKIDNTGIVTNINTNLRLRQGAGNSSAIVGYLIRGEKVNIKAKSDEWYKVESDGKVGFVHKDFIKLNGKLDVPTINPSSTNLNGNIKVNKEIYGIVQNVKTNLRIRSEANDNSSVTAYLLPGASFKIIENKGSWYKIECNNKIGYIKDIFIKKTDKLLNDKNKIIVPNDTKDTNNTNEVHKNKENQKINNKHNDSKENKIIKKDDKEVKPNKNKHFNNAYSIVLTSMESQIGKPYIYGGTGEKGFDCSGLMEWGFNKVGINIGRTTWDQISSGYEVAKNSVKPGDLLFFCGINHVGMYIGNNEWIEAPRPGESVRITNVPWSKIGRVRRVLN